MYEFSRGYFQGCSIWFGLCKIIKMLKQNQYDMLVIVALH